MGRIHFIADKAIVFVGCAITICFVALLAACSPDSETGGKDSHNGYADIRICLSAQSAQKSQSRASFGQNEGWTDKNASPGEMMRRCFVVVVQNGEIETIIQSKDFDSEKNLTETLAARIKTGTTTFYSFANMRPSDVGLDAGASFPTPLPEGFENRLFSVNGNQNKVSGFNDGIPMSNRQTIDILPTTERVDLEVVRMVAKVRLLLTNETPQDIKVRQVSLSDITCNEASNISLFPKTDDTGAIVPSIGASAAHGTYTVDLGDTCVLKAKSAEPHTVEFYVNESQADVPKYFVISLDTDQKTISQRVAFLNWNTISRGDLLVIPIRLNDYSVRFDVEQFTAIGVLPDVQSDDNQLTVRFHGYGEFHIRPHVIRVSDGKELTPGTDSKDGWLFASWSTLEMSSSGGDGTSIYDKAPVPVGASQTFEGVMGNRSGYAIHQMLFRIKGLGYDIPYKIQIIKE